MEIYSYPSDRSAVPGASSGVYTPPSPSHATTVSNYQVSYNSNPNAEHFYHPFSSERVSEKFRLALHKVLNQAAFFNLVMRLGLPVLDKHANQSGGSDQVYVGRGGTYQVAHGRMMLPQGHRDTIAVPREGDDWKLDKRLLDRPYVTKRIALKDAHKFSDAEILEAITQEVRILGHKTIKESEYIVRLFAIAWDERPGALDRRWPRLLLEAADFGTLTQFMASSPDIKSWTIKCQLLSDVLCGIIAIHNHDIVHLDIKPENTLICRYEEEDPENPVGIRYQAKICDFGSAIILSDYDQKQLEQKFSGMVGTARWNPPEFCNPGIAGGEEIHMKLMPKSDIYCFGMLMIRVFMEGGDPFGSLSDEEINHRKRTAKYPILVDGEIVGHSDILDDIYKAVFETVTTYDETHQNIIKSKIYETLCYYPEYRTSPDTLARDLIFYGGLFFDDQAENQTAEEEEELSSIPAEMENSVQKSHIIVKAVKSIFRFGRNILLSIPRIVRRIFSHTIRYFAIRIIDWVGWIRDPSKYFDQLGLIPAPLNIEPIPRLQDDINDQQKDKEIPDFEDREHWNPSRVSPSFMKEMLELLHRKVSAYSGPHDAVSVEAMYQIAVSYFEGIGVQKDRIQGLQWLERAATSGSTKAIQAIPNIFASMNQEVPPKLSAIYESKLPDIAKSQLQMSVIGLFNNKLRRLDEYTSIERWRDEDPKDYDEYVTGNLGVQNVDALSFAILLRVIEGEMRLDMSDEQDFSLLDGHDPTSEAQIQEYEKQAFIESVKTRGWERKPGKSTLTLLQTAAAKGDLGLAKILIKEIGVDVDDDGIVSHLSPLIISCMCGHFEIALFLLKNGANPTCREPFHRRTIMHFLHQFESEREIMRIFETGINAGLDVEVKDNVDITPLVSTFIGRDRSRGVAANFLRVMGANSLIENNLGFTPLRIAVARLDVPTVEATLESLRNLEAEIESSKDSEMVLLKEWRSGYSHLFSTSEFQRRKVFGSKLVERLRQLVELVAEQTILAKIADFDDRVEVNPLLAAAFQGQEDMILAILKSKVCPDVNVIGGAGGHTSALDWAAERGSYYSILALLRAGANPFNVDSNGETFFHRCAIFQPKVLLELIQGELKGWIWPNNYNTEDIINMRNPLGESPWAKLVLEGTADHLEVAEELHGLYNMAIDYDSYCFLHAFKPEGVKTSLMANMIHYVCFSNIFSLEQAEYILYLDPAPRFIADTSESTLLHYAVDNWLNIALGSNEVGLQLLKSILNVYPNKAFLEVKDENGDTPIHLAAMHSNQEALKIFKSHLDMTEQRIDMTATNNEGRTPLDLVTETKVVDLNEIPFTRQVLHESVRENTMGSWKTVREMGGLSPIEKDGLTLRFLSTPQSQVTEEQLKSWMATITGTQAYDLEWGIFKDPGFDDDRKNTIKAYYVLELYWKFDRFGVRATLMHSEQVADFAGARATARTMLADAGYGAPWTKNEFEDDLAGNKVTWKRPGRVWTVEERKSLTDFFMASVSDLCGGDLPDPIPMV